MTDAQIQLQNALTTTFLANLVFLSEYDNELYHRVDELSRMIENGTYEEKYALEFIMENGEFDIYDIKNNKYVYNKNPKKIINELVRKVEFDEKNSILNIADYVLFKKNKETYRENRFNFDEIKNNSALSIEDISEYTNLTDDYLENKKKRLKKIDKFIFIGTLLGRHIPKIAQKVNADIYLVLERNLEIFRLSLFTVDYTILAKKGVIFSIMDKDLEEKTKIKKFLDIAYLYNYLLKFSSTNINIDEYIDGLLSFLDMEKPIRYDYNRQLYTNINRTTNYIKNGYKILLFNKKLENNDIFKDTPILYLAAGPSLDENINWIKENQNKFFIVTIGAAYKKLLKNDIKVDMIATLDEQYHILNTRQFDDISVSNISNNTIILASTITNEKILKKFNQKNLFLYEVFVSLYKDNFAFDGFSIGEITLGILLKLNAKRIYLIGLDLALNQKTGASHSQDANSGVFKLNLETEQNRGIFNDRKSLLKVKGNLQDEVFTTSTFFSSIKSAEIYLFKKNKDVEIFNLSTHGAYIEETIPKNINEITINTFKDISINNTDIKNILGSFSANDLDKETKELLKEKILFLEKDIKGILNDILDSDFKTFDEFFEKIHQIPNYIFKNNNINLYSIIINYFKIVSPYLFYHFNDLKVKNEAKKVKKIKETFVNQIKHILDDYILCINRILN